MRPVGHSVRWVPIESLKIVFMGTDDHHVWANVEIMAGRAIFRKFPEAEIHVRDADAINVRRAARQGCPASTAEMLQRAGLTENPTGCVFG
jgi:hypothetical protein